MGGFTVKYLTPLLLLLPFVMAFGPEPPIHKPRVRMNPRNGSRVGALEVQRKTSALPPSPNRTWSFEHPMAGVICEIKGSPCVVFLIETNSTPSTNGRRFYRWVTNASMTINVSVPGQAFLFVTASDRWTHAVSPVGPVKEMR